jgi:Fe2+ transport system protein B
MKLGILGLISLGIKARLLKWNAPEWVVGFFYDGLLNGVTAVLGVCPTNYDSLHFLFDYGR